MIALYGFLTLGFALFAIWISVVWLYIAAVVGAGLILSVVILAAAKAQQLVLRIHKPNGLVR